MISEKKSLLRFARDNHFLKVNKNEVELLSYHQDELIRILMDKQDQPKVSRYNWHGKYERGCLQIRSAEQGSLHNIILGERRAKIQDIPRDKKGRLDYRKQSLLPAKENYSNNYRLLNKKEMELRIVKKGKTFRVRFDRDDYQRLKTYIWCVRSIGNGNQGVFSIQTGMALTTLILDDKSVRVKKIPKERLGRMDYRKASLLAQVASYSNEYHVLNKKEVELYIVKKDQEFRAIFDREDYRRVKARHWRIAYTSAGVAIIGGQTSVALTKVIFKDPSVRIRQIPVDPQGRLDYRKQSLLSVIDSYLNTYRNLNKKEVELRISKTDRELRIIFDREDYKNVKAHHWPGEYTNTGSVVITSGPNDLTLARVIFKDQKVRVNQIPRDDQDRLDYRKKSSMP